MIDIRAWALGFILLIAASTGLVFIADCLTGRAAAQGMYHNPVLRKHYPVLPEKYERTMFEPGDSSLTPAAISVLKMQAASIRAQPKAPVTIYGFADAAEGSEEVAATLARRRAEVVRDYLIAQGLALHRHKIEVILPPASYNPPLAGGWPRPTHYVLTRLSPWDE